LLFILRVLLLNRIPVAVDFRQAAVYVASVTATVFPIPSLSLHGSLLRLYPAMVTGGRIESVGLPEAQTVAMMTA
jgi:hypothetical protein